MRDAGNTWSGTRKPMVHSPPPFFGVQNLRARPIPSQAPMVAAREGYRDHPIDTDCARNAERLDDTARHGLAGRNLYGTDRNPPYYERPPGGLETIWLRTGVIAALTAINARIQPAGLELYLSDGWRPDEVQAFFHDLWVPRRLRARNPSLTPAEVRERTLMYWSAPTVDCSRPAPHRTGGAVDLSLRWIGGDSLWMGCLIDDPRPIAHINAFEAVDDPMALSDLEARDNRRLLHWLMVEAGFAANPYEWWHFSLGDQMWARLTGHDTAFYGAASLSPE